MWRSLDHKFILPFLGIYKAESVSRSFLVTPYMEKGTLVQWRKKTNPSIAEIEQLVTSFSLVINGNSLYVRYWKSLKASHTSILKV